MDGGVCHSRIPVEKIYMANSIHEEEYFNPLDIEDDVFSYESPAYLLFEQHTQSYDNESVDTIDSANNMQELEDKHKDMVRGPNLDIIISRWHVLSTMLFMEKVRYGNKSIEDTTRERRYYEWVAQNTEFNDNDIPQEATMYDNHCKYHHEYPDSYFP
ncbi:hypothetical protein Tco_0062408 [Tanacetum coccineum]